MGFPFLPGRNAIKAASGFDPNENWLVDPGFDNAPIWDNIGNGDVNATFPSEVYVHDTSGPIYYQATNGLKRVPPDGSYRLIFPAADHVTSLNTSSTQVQFGKGAITNVSGAIPAGAWAAGGVFNFTVTGCTTKRFGLKFNSGAVLDFAIPGLILNRVS
jgi:hypothetical protein